MIKLLVLFVLFMLAVPHSAFAWDFESDSFDTSRGSLKITFIGHGSVMFEFDGKTIHVDPFSKMGDYTKLPKADLILITHEHQDHFDMNALEILRTPATALVVTETVAGRITGGIVMHNGDERTVMGLKIEAVPAYNLVHMRSEGVPFHPKGVGNGYIVTFGGKRVYLAGDTENIPEMKNIKGIDIAFLPMNLPYTMTPEMVAGAAKSFKPKVLYPYHFSETDTAKIVDLLKDEKEIEVRIRKMN
ncbi:MAG: MBL fold metallo-hydrolase [Syntrophobacteraceae bacterium]